MTQWTKVPIAKLQANPENPRFIRDDRFRKLVDSVKQFPQMLELRPVVVNSDYMILGGNMRYQAALNAGLKDIPVVVADGLTEQQQREFIIKDNVSSGDWQWESLANTWDSIELTDWGLNTPDWGRQDLIEMVNRGDEHSEWVGMPEFEASDKPFQIIISFEADQTREEFAKSVGIPLQKSGKLTWSTRWPIQDRDDLKNLRYE